MKNTFRTWLEKKIRENESPFAKFQHNSDHDLGAQDYEKMQRELISLLCNRYSSDFFNFVEGLANQRNDGELSEIMRRMNRENMSPTKNPRHPKEPDDVVVPTADRAGGSDSDED